MRPVSLALTWILAHAATPPLGRVAVCFFGVNRSLNRTVDSVERHVLAPLAAASSRLDVFFHTYSLATITSAWSGERAAAVPGAVEMLRLLDEPPGRVRQWAATNQRRFDEETDYRAYYAFAADATTVRRQGRAVARNVLRALHSLREVTLLWTGEAAAAARPASSLDGSRPRGRLAAQGAIGGLAAPRDLAGLDVRGHYDYVVYARPDLRFASPVDVGVLARLGADELYTPRWGCWMGGVNDRFAAARPAAAAAFGARLELLPNVTRLPTDHAQRRNGLHGELFARYALEIAGVRPVFADAPCARRVRADGREASRDCELATKPRHCHARLCVVSGGGRGGGDNPCQLR